MVINETAKWITIIIGLIIVGIFLYYFYGFITSNNTLVL